ncbi:MAG TPA: dethiobiotin synthase [Polyangiaceae bacterium]
MILFVTATGTGVGKTWLSCALARELAGHARVVAIKPVETGGGDDGELLAAATGQREPLRALLRFRDPLTPALAAEREGAAMDFDALVADVARLAKDFDHAIVEGAGGVLSPLTYEADATDLARRLDAKVLLVAPDALGTLSATLAAMRCLPPSAIALIEPSVRDASTGTNATVLRRRLGDVCPRIFEIARGDTTNVGAIARVLASIA